MRCTSKTRALARPYKYSHVSARIKTATGTGSTRTRTGISRAACARIRQRAPPPHAGFPWIRKQGWGDRRGRELRDGRALQRLGFESLRGHRGCPRTRLPLSLLCLSISPSLPPSLPLCTPLYPCTPSIHLFALESCSRAAPGIGTTNSAARECLMANHMARASLWPQVWPQIQRLLIQSCSHTYDISDRIHANDRGNQSYDRITTSVYLVHISSSIPAHTHYQQQ